MARAGETLTPVSPELGSKDPMIVLDDADLDRAAAWGGMMNSGQICMSVERIYIEELIYNNRRGPRRRCSCLRRQGADRRKPVPIPRRLLRVDRPCGRRSFD
jgi:hypothetical protein